MIDAAIAAALACALSAATIFVLCRRPFALPADVPNARSLHAQPVPRAGGYAIWAGFLPAALLYPPSFPGGLPGWLPAWLALVIVSGRDDVREVGVATRLAVHALAALWAATAIAWTGPDLMRALAMLPAIALAIAWSENLYNFMDGTDGLAGTMGVIGFSTYGVAAIVTHDEVAAASAPAFFALAAATLPFLRVNLPRATMFLGDVGAVPLGFLAAAFGCAGVAGHMWPAWFAPLVFLPFLADATLTLARRIGRHERLWEGHRGHYYQRLAQMRAGHGGTLAAYGILMAGCAVTALVVLVQVPLLGWWALTAWLIVVVMLFATIDYHWRKNTNVFPGR